MQVIKRLKINSIASIITAFIILLLLSLVLYRVNLAMEKSSIAGDIMSISFERATLRTDYQQTGIERAKVQFFSKHEQIGQLLQDASSMFEDAEDKKTIKEMINNHESIGRIFAAIVTNREETRLGLYSTDLSREIENRLINQANMRLYNVTLQVHKLQESSTKALFSALRLGGGGIVCMLAILIAAVVVNTWSMSRAITNRVRMLRDGASVIGGGDLAYKIDVKGDDEFAELSGAFNTMAEKLRGSYRNLENEIEERKRTEDEVLKLSKVMAARNLELEAANREMESFIYSISHDLRAPIRTMSGFAKIINEDYAGKLDAQGQDYLGRILKGSAKATQLIDDLLRLSKISRYEIDRIEVNLSDKASKLVDELRELHPGRNVEVVVQEGLTAYADPRLMELVLSNLLGNAWKFTSKTEKARIEFGSITKDGKTIFYVKDNGAGFDSAHADKIFWPFHRLHLESEFEGTGIGLAIVEGIIRRHEGRVWAEGVVGKGATIYFTLLQRSSTE